MVILTFHASFGLQFGLSRLRESTDPVSYLKGKGNDWKEKLLCKNVGLRKIDHLDYCDCDLSILDSSFNSDCETVAERKISFFCCYEIQ